MMNIVVVGGGAGGLELATSLGRKLGKNKARITLVDRNRTPPVETPAARSGHRFSMDAGIGA